MRGHTRGLARGGRGQEDRALQAEEMTPEDQSPVANVEGRGGQCFLGGDRAFKKVIKVKYVGPNPV